MGLTGTVNANDALVQGYQPLLLVAITLQGTSTPLLLSTHPLDGVSGPTFPGIGSLPAGNYIGRLSQQDIEPLQWRSELGVDRLSKFTIHIMDPDLYIYTNICIPYGFRGATMVVGIVMWEAGTNHFTSDAPIKFRGVCDMERPIKGMTTVTVTATTGHNMAVILLPLFPLENRCPLSFPKDATERAEAVKAHSDMCPYSVDQSGGVGNLGPANHVNAYGDQVTDGAGVFLMCDKIRSNSGDATSGCMPRLGNPAATTVAPDGDLKHDTTGRHTGAFAGIEWSPGTYYAINRNYASNSKIATFSFLNASILGDFVTLLYGEQMVTAKPANVIESGNDTKCEAIICTGDIGDVPLTVIVNGIQLNRNPSGDPNLWYDFLNTGGRFGSMNTDTGYRNANFTALGDPYGSMACIRTVFYKDIFTGFGSPTIQVISPGPNLWVFAPIATSVGNGSTITATFPSGVTNPHIGGAGSVFIFGSSLSGANGEFTAVNASFGPPGSVTYTAAVSGSGTGGYIGGLSGTAKSNPAIILLDILRRCRWDLTEINLTTFYLMALFCDQPISYIDQMGNTSTHARYKCKFAVEKQKSAAEIVAAICRGFNAYLYWDENTGLLCLDVCRPLADSQPAVVPGSNNSTPQTGLHADGSSGTGYVAHVFDESNIAVVGSPGDEHLDIEWIDNATSQTPNQVYINFQDEDNQYVVDSLGEIDTEAMTRAGGTLQPGGSLVPESLVVLGPPNFDQVSRIANTFLAERQYGNEDNVPKGTRIADVGVSCDVTHLRGGHLVFLNLQRVVTNQLFRILSIKPETNFESARVIIQWENDIWRTDAYGQQPQSFHSNAFTNRPSRIPLPWQPDAETPNSIMYPASERSFQLTETDTVQGNGDILIQFQISGKNPINQAVAACQPPLVPLYATVASTGGSIPGGVTLFIEICAIDAAGKYSPPSNIITATIPAGTNTNTITISNLGWGSGTGTYDVMIGTDRFNITFQQTGSGTPSTITITSVPNVLRYAAPDLAVGEIEVIAKNVVHAGIIGSQVVSRSALPNIVNIGAPLSGTLGSVAGRKLALLGRPNINGTALPIIDFTIVSNSGSALTVDRDPTGLILDLDVVVITAQVTSATSTTLTDTLLVNAFAPGGVTVDDVGKLIRIVRGKGIGQVRTIGAVSGGDTYTVTREWDIALDTTSVFIVEDAEFKYNSSLSQVNESVYQVTRVASLELSNIRNQAILIMALTVDPTGNLYSNEFRSPYRVMWLFGTQGTRTIIASTTQVVTDGWFICNAMTDITIQLLPADQWLNGVIGAENDSPNGSKVTIQFYGAETDGYDSSSIVIAAGDRWSGRSHA